MQNIATIYRFKTPFLDIRSERRGLLLILENIKKVIKFNGMYFQETRKDVWDYIKISLVFQDGLWKITFYYIKTIDLYEGKDPSYFLPIFKMDIYIHDNFLTTNELKKKGVNFITWVFESFDWVNEKEFLLDLHSEFYFIKWFFRNKTYPHNDFSNISVIQKKFEKNKWMTLLEWFISQFSDSHFVLTKENSKYYHQIHSIMLYFIFLVYIIYQNLEKSTKARNILEEYVSSNNEEKQYDQHTQFMEKRLHFVDDLNYSNFKQYREKLNGFFKLF